MVETTQDRAALTRFTLIEATGYDDSFKYSLRHLTRVLLHRVIQSPHQPHCSRQDAQTSLDLAAGRARQGTAFDLHDTKSTTPGKALTRRSNNGNDNAAVAIGPSAWLEKYMECQATPAHALFMETVLDSTTARTVLSYVANHNKSRDEESNSLGLDTLPCLQ